MKKSNTSKNLDRRNFLRMGAMGTACSVVAPGLIIASPGRGNPELPAPADWVPPVQLDYGEKDGIYMLTYSSTTNSPTFERKMDIALSQDYIKGISHYMEWDKLEPVENEYDWRQLDLVFDRVKKYGKYCIIGFQAGVMAPRWLLERPIVKTVDFIHGNPGWTAWSTIKTPVELNEKTEVLSRMALPWDKEYNRCLEKTLQAISDRYEGESCITFVNICGPSASAGVEANFNVQFALSRAANPRFDQELGFTLDKYSKAWKDSIDMHMRVFQKSRLCLGAHDKIGDSGYEDGRIVYYSGEVQMEHVRDFRDYFLDQFDKLWGKKGVVRNCGMNTSVSWWGNPDTIADKPASNFTAVQWEVRDRARIGYESASVSNRGGLGGDNVTLPASEFARLVHNGITGYGRYLEIKVLDIVDDMKPFELYQPVLEEAARIYGYM